MADLQVRDAFERMADSMKCPSCGHIGFTWSWKTVDPASVGRTTLGADKVPLLTCQGCDVEVDAI